MNEWAEKARKERESREDLCWEHTRKQTKNQSSNKTQSSSTSADTRVLIHFIRNDGRTTCASLSSQKGRGEAWLTIQIRRVTHLLCFSVSLSLYYCCSGKGGTFSCGAMAAVGHGFHPMAKKQSPAHSAFVCLT